MPLKNLKQLTLMTVNVTLIAQTNLLIKAHIRTKTCVVIWIMILD